MGIHSERLAIQLHLTVMGEAGELYEFQSPQLLDHNLCLLSIVFSLQLVYQIESKVGKRLTSGNYRLQKNYLCQFTSKNSHVKHIMQMTQETK